MLFKTISEFALEYRTTRERVIQQLYKKSNYRERNKTRGKMITEVSNFVNSLVEYIDNIPYKLSNKKKGKKCWLLIGSES